MNEGDTARHSLHHGSVVNVLGNVLGKVRNGAAFTADFYRERARITYRARADRDPMARLWTNAGRGDPYAIYDEIRARGPIVPSAVGDWASATYQVCDALLRDRRFGVRQADSTYEPYLSLLDTDPPDHTRLRRLIAPAFSPRRMTSWQPRVEKLADSLLDEAGGEFDFVSAYATRLPVSVIGDLLGVPVERAADFARWGLAIGSALDGTRSLRDAAAQRRADTELTAIFTDLLALRRKEPADDVVSMIVAEEGAAVRPAELIPMCRLLLIAGFETTANLISNMVLALLANPEQWQAVVDDPSLAAAAVDETLRFDPPVQQTGRFAHEDVDLAGVPVPRGAFVTALLGGANRDPAVHTDPHRFDLTREQRDNLAFSSGVHYCIGRPLAHLEATIALQRLVMRAPTLRQTGPVTRRRGTTIRGPLRLPVAV